MSMFTKALPVEDPVRITRFSTAIGQLDWAPLKYRTSLGILFQQLGELTHAEIRYYYSRRNSSRILSRIFRFLAWALGSFGLLIPLIHPILSADAPKTFLSWGYIAFGMAVSVLIADSVFAGTQANQRYVKAQLELEQLYTIFSLEWQALLVKLDSSPTLDNTSALIDRAVIYSKAFHGSMGNETSEWQKAMNDGIAELKGKIKPGNKGT